MSRRECNAQFVELLNYGSDQHLISTEYIRKFFETARCDVFEDMAYVRKDYTYRLGQERLDRILNKTSDNSDELVAAQAAMRCHSRDKVYLLGAVSLWSLLKFNCTTFLRGFGNPADGGQRAAINSFWHLARVEKK